MRYVTVLLFLAAVVAANLLVAHFGPSSTPYVAAGLVGAALIFRDSFASAVGVRRVMPQLALILAGALLTWLLNRDAAVIARASVIAFAASEAMEGTVYFLARRRPWMERAPLSAVCGAAVDSVLFLSIAFGFSFPLVFAQFCAKGIGAWAWSWLLRGGRGTLLPRDA